MDLLEKLILHRLCVRKINFSNPFSNSRLKVNTMSTQWSDWKRFGLFLLFVAVLVMGITVWSVGTAEARSTLQQSYSFSPHNACQVLSPDDTTSYISAKFAEMTGQAVSPLLSLTVIGWFRNLCTEEQYKDLLPWYYQTGFLVLILVVLLFLTFKDTLLTPMGPLKQPLDALGEFIHTVSGLVALPISVLYFADSISSPIDQNVEAIAPWLFPVAQAADGSGVVASVPNLVVPVGLVVGVSLGVIIFSLNWLFGNIVDVLIFLSPIPFVDTTLSAIRSAVIGIVIFLAYLSPPFAGLLALIIFGMAFFVFRWAFRLLTVGMVYGADILRLKWRQFELDDDGVLAFSGKGLSRRQSGILGRVLPGDTHTLRFEYYPYLILPKKQVLIPVDPVNDGDILVTRGLIAPTVTKVEVLSGKGTTLFRLAPRCRNHEAAIAHYLGLSLKQEVTNRSNDSNGSWLGWSNPLF
jgi:hypothetical protein